VEGAWGDEGDVDLQRGKGGEEGGREEGREGLSVQMIEAAGEGRSLCFPLLPSLPPSLPPCLPPSPPEAHRGVCIYAPRTGTAACVVEVEADATPSGRVPRHAPEARRLGEGGREGGRGGGREGGREEGSEEGRVS